MNDRDLIELARRLPFVDPPGQQVEEMRTAVLAMMPTPASGPTARRHSLMGTGLLAAAAAVFVAFVVTRPQEPAEPAAQPYNATVTAVGTATFVRMRMAGDEIIRLTEGLVHLDVEPLQAGERCRVIVGDGEVEVRGTSFEVEAHRDRLARVSVAHGRVEVRSHGAVTILGAGARWTPSRIAQSTVSAPSVPSVPASALPEHPRPSGSSVRRSDRDQGPETRPSSKHASRTIAVESHRAPSELISQTPPAPTSVVPSVASALSRAESEFRTGWAALQAGDPKRAAEAFDRVVKLDPTGGISEDAAFWRAVAFIHAGETARARAGFVTFFEAYPSSVRAGEAAVLFGRLLLDTGDLDEAERQFVRASHDQSVRVRTASESGLAEVARRRRGARR